MWATLRAIYTASPTTDFSPSAAMMPKEGPPHDESCGGKFSDRNFGGKICGETLNIGPIYSGVEFQFVEEKFA